MPPATGPRIFVSAGEPSGDLHGARLVTALRTRFPSAEIHALGGPAMAAAGADVRHRMEGLSALGVAEVLSKLPSHLRLLRTLRGAFRAGAYDLVILIDYPGFHLRLAEAARRVGTRVLYYIAPQLWAWHPGRARRFAGAVDRLAVILPFEAEFFGRLGIEARFVGHPLVDRQPLPDRARARAQLSVDQDSRVLALLPGSRGQEIARHWPAFRTAALRLLDEGRCDAVLVAGTGSGSYPEPGPIRIVRGDPLPVFAAADAALAKSGTTTLEAALADTPMVVAYQTHPVTYAVFERVRTVPWVSLVNLVAGRAVVPELLQGRVNPADLINAIRPLLDPSDPATVEQRAGLAEVRDRLGQPGAARRVVELAAELLPAWD